MSDPTDPASYSGYAEPADATSSAPRAVRAARPGPTGRPPPPRPGAPEPVLITIGDIAVTRTQVITPNGVFPLKDTNWFLIDQATVTRVTPSWAIAAAIVSFFVVCVLGLLFLLVKEQRVTGTVQVTVQGPGWMHVTQLPRTWAGAAQHQVASVRNLVAALD